MPIELVGAPAEISAALERLRDDLARAAGNNLAGLILFGGLARGSYRVGRSDVNLVVLLHDASAGALAAVAGVLQRARRAIGVDPLILTPLEVPLAADAFPTKFLDIKRRHIVLAGVNPFVKLEVTHEQVRLRSEQELRNMLLRMRYRFVAAARDALDLTQTLAQFTRPLAIQLGALLGLSGQEPPSEGHTADVFAAAAEAFDLKRETLLRLAELRQDESPRADASACYGDMLEVIARMIGVAEGLKDSNR